MNHPEKPHQATMKSMRPGLVCTRNSPRVQALSVAYCSFVRNVYASYEAPSANSPAQTAREVIEGLVDGSDWGMYRE